AWVTADFAARSSAGGEGTEKILLAIGPRAVPRLSEVLLPGPDLLPVASVLGKLADEPARDKAVEGLLAKQRNPRAPGDGMMQAVGMVSGKKATSYLIDLAEHGSGEELRQHALLALAQGRLQNGSEINQPALDEALKICGDAHVPGGVREAAFQLA